MKRIEQKSIKQGDCGVACVAMLASATELLREYTFAVKLKKAPYLLTNESASLANEKTKNLETSFGVVMNSLKGCVIADGNSFDAIDKLFGEMGEAVSVRADSMKATQLEQIGRQLSEAFLNSHVTNLQGVDATPGQTTIEGFLENLLTKAEIVRWIVKGNFYRLEAKYSSDILVIEMTHSPKTDSTAISGVLNKRILNAEEVLGLTKVVYIR
jgi:hypothetical protein